MKTEALKLADELEALYQYVPSEAPAMIRRLVEELDKPHKYDPETGEPLIDGYPLFSGLPRGKPLSDEEMLDCVDNCFGLMALQYKYIYDIDQIQEYGLKLARAIEDKHGIR